MRRGVRGVLCWSVAAGIAALSANVCHAQSVTAQATVQLTVQPLLTGPDAVAIAQAMERGRREGIAAPDASNALAALASPDPAAREAADQTLSGFATDLAGAEHGMRIAPQSVDHNFALRQSYDASKDFAAARQAGRVAVWAQSLTPADPAYANLVAARARYAAIIAAGGWPTVPAGKTLKLAADDPRTPILRQRLNVEGYAAGPAPTPPPAGAPPAPRPRTTSCWPTRCATSRRPTT